LHNYCLSVCVLNVQTWKYEFVPTSMESLFTIAPVHFFSAFIWIFHLILKWISSLWKLIIFNLWCDDHHRVLCVSGSWFNKRRCQFLSQKIRYPIFSDHTAFYCLFSFILNTLAHFFLWWFYNFKPPTQIVFCGFSEWNFYHES
jgi:hypothetical protein